MKRGLILNNAYYETPATLYQSERLQEELLKLGVKTDVKKNDFFAAEIENGAVKGVNGYDFCIFLDKDKYAARALESAGLRLFNRREAIELCDDKALTFLALAGSGIPAPKTLPGLLCYSPEAEFQTKTAEYIAKTLGFPLIVKESYGSLGKFVYKADDMPSLIKICKELKCRPHLFQKFVSESAGKDIRAIVIGGKTVAAMKRTSTGDFRSNIGLGGKGEPYNADGELTALCEKTAALLNLDYCGIDVLFGKDGYLLCEVNSNAFFGGIESATGVNVAKAYAEHILKSIN